MKKLQEDIVITDGNMDLLLKSLDEKKVVLAAVEMGAGVSKAVADKWSDYFKAHIQVKEETNEGVCFCHKPATHLVYIWR